MPSVQNSETWALSQANPKTYPIFPPNRTNFPPNRTSLSQKTELVFPKNGACSLQKRSMFFPTWSMFFQKKEHVFPKNGTCFSQKRSFTKPVADFPKVGGWFFQSLWQVFLTSVADFPFPQNRWRISPKSVTDFLKIGVRFPQSQWRVSLESVADFLKNGTALLPKTGAIFLARTKPVFP